MRLPPPMSWCCSGVLRMNPSGFLMRLPPKDLGGISGRVGLYQLLAEVVIMYGIMGWMADVGMKAL